MTARKVKAEYRDQVLPEYQGNPLIMALPDIMSAEETLFCLTRTPVYSKEERKLDAKYRLHCLSRLMHDYYQPLAQHLDIENRISVCLRQGYRNRNPLERQYNLMVNESYAAMIEKRSVRAVPGYHPNASGFTIIGVSGVGKSTAVESILFQYPQVIEHTEFRGQLFPATQIVWLKLDTPHDGSRGELCYRFFKAVDDAVGSEYFDQYKKSRITIDSMLTLMQRIAQEYSLGLLVVDEVQHLSLAKGGSDAMLNFFVTLVNTIGVPWILTIFSFGPGFVHFYNNQDKTSFDIPLCFVYDHQPWPASFLRYFRTSKKRWLRLTATYKVELLRHVVCPHFYLPLTNRASTTGVSVCRRRFPSMSLLTDPPEKPVAHDTNVFRGNPVVTLVVPFGCDFWHDGEEIIFALLWFPAAAYRTAM